MLNEFNPFPEYQNFHPSNGSGTENPEKIIKYNLTAPEVEGSVEVCLVAGILANTNLVGRCLTDGSFKAVIGQTEISVVSEDGVKLEHSQTFDLFASLVIKEFRIAPTTLFNAMTFRNDCLLKVGTVDNKGVLDFREVKGDFDNEKNLFVFPVGERMTFEKSIYFTLLSEMSVDIEVIY